MRYALISIAPVKRMRICLYCVLGLVLIQQVFAGQVLASVNQVERPEEELLILELYVNDQIRNSGMIAYLPKGASLDQTLIPIAAFARILSLSVSVEPSEGIAEGWLYKERNVFQLDLNRNIVFANGKERPISQNDAEAHFEDIYVKASVLENWLGISIRPDLSTLRMFVTGSIPFPFEEDLARKKRADSLASNTANAGVSYNPDTLVPYQWIAPPSFVWQQTLQARRDDTSTSANTNFSLQSYGDVLKSGARFIVSGTTGTDDNATKINTAQGFFQKRDPGKTLLGPLQAGRITVGDVTYPDVPLVVGRKRGRGVAISSDSTLHLSRSFGAETYDVDGDAPLGWDAELYRNGYFVAFQEVGDNGRYSFEDVELVRGYNLFQIVLYGPEGQKRTQTQRIIRGQEMLQAGEVNYDIAAGQPEADFIPIAENARTDSTFGGSARVAYGIKNYLTVSASAFTGSDSTSSEDTRLSAVNMSAVTSFLGFKTQVQYMKANEGRSAYSVETTTRVAGANVTVSHTKYDGFQKDDRDLVSTTGIDANRNFGIFSASLRAEKNKFQTDAFQNKDDEIYLQGNVSTRIAGVSISNSLERTISDNAAQEDYEGDLSILTNLMDWRLRGNLQFDLDHEARDTFRNANISAYKKLSRTATLRLNTAYDFPNNILSSDLRYSQEFDKYSIDANVGGSTRNDLFGGVTFRTGFQPDSDGRYQMVSARDGGLGAVSLRAYLDEDGSHTYEMGEKLLSNITFRSNRGLVDAQTNQDGAVFVNGLSEGLTRFEVDEASLPSIYIKPYQDHIDIIPRSGASTTLYMGFEQLGEIDGFIQMPTDTDPKKAVPGVDIRLVDNDTGEEIATATSEYDGYYVFPAIALGSYHINVTPSWRGDDVFALDVDLTLDRPIATDQNIMIPPRAKIQLASALLPSTQHADVKNVIEDEPLPVVTDGLDMATGEALRGLFIHLGSLSSFDSAQQEQKRLWARYPALLKDTPLYIYKIKVGSKTFFRIVGLIPTYEDGRRVCDALIKQSAAGGCRLVEL